MTPPTPLRARWFDGASSQARTVLVVLEPAPGGPQLALHAPGQPPRRFAHGAVEWPEEWNPRRPPPRLVVDLGDGGSLEIDDPATWQAMLSAAGHRPGLAQRMQTRWPVFAAVLVLAAAGLFLFYRHGTPWLATQLTRHVPLAWETALSQQVLHQMDDGTLKPSKLAPERQAELRARFDALLPHLRPRYAGHAPRYTLAFRSGLGANAFALPGGTVVVTDALVEAARKHQLGDDAIVGVLAHEIGHVAHRHGTRMVVEQGVLNIGLGLALGDVSTIVSTGASLLTGLSYQRSHETESDCYALAMMKKAGLPTAPMADLLLGVEHQMEEKMRQRGKSDGSSAPTEKPEAAARQRQADWFSTHPDTEGRAQRLKTGQALGCSQRKLLFS